MWSSLSSWFSVCMMIHLLYTRNANLVHGALDLGMKHELISPYFKNNLHRPTYPDGDFVLPLFPGPISLRVCHLRKLSVSWGLVHILPDVMNSLTLVSSFTFAQVASPFRRGLSARAHALCVRLGVSTWKVAPNSRMRGRASLVRSFIYSSAKPKTFFVQTYPTSLFNVSFSEKSAACICLLLRCRFEIRTHVSVCVCVCCQLR